ncbi:hypothetical protein [Blautia sp.]|uniref:hypothetical protein n=1 Tax=Blautia sp. TaxID=1955243 RepID=UPI002E7A9E8B|nr:hypothetical protein [Blautia sp.]MEE0811734.1 hypothetical protein [Blautia sp.]
MSDIVLVDIPSLKTAIEKFHASSTRIGEYVSSLQSNATEISNAIKSEASNIYRAKMDNLGKNVSNAQMALNTQISQLEELCNKSEMAEKKAQGIAQALESNFMEY